MFASRRAFAAVPRSRLATGRSIAPLLRYSSTEAAAPATTPAAESTTTTTTATPAVAAKTRTFTPRTRVKAPVPPKAVAPAPKPAPSSVSTGVPPEFIWQPATPPAAKQTFKKPIEDINWEKSFYGLATSPVTPEQFKVLTKPLELTEVQVKPDGIIYLPEIRYRRRLNEAFGPMGWGIVPRGEAVVGKEIVTREYALIVNGCFVSQSQGVNNYFSPEGIPQAVEGAKSNALMRCCKDLGIASELWDPQFVSWFNKNHIVSTWVEHAVTKKKRRHFYRKDGQPEVTYPYKMSA